MSYEVPGITLIAKKHTYQLQKLAILDQAQCKEKPQLAMWEIKENKCFLYPFIFHHFHPAELSDAIACMYVLSC